MRHFIEIVSKEPNKDSMGFASQGECVLATARAYKESRHGNTAWRNRAAFSTANALFRFRVIPNLVITTAIFIRCSNEMYNILSVENVRERGMYIEVLAEKTEPSKG
jgi:head-tail adaptor